MAKGASDKQAAAGIIKAGVSRETPATADESHLPKGGTVKRIRRELLYPNPLNPRKLYPPSAIEEMAASLAEHGQLQDILVRPHPTIPDAFQRAIGETRWRASAPEYADLKFLNCRIRDLTDAQMLDIAWHENAFRTPLTALENARYFHTRRTVFAEVDADTLRNLAEDSQYSHQRIAQLLHLLDLPDYIIGSVEDETVPPFEALQLNEKHGRAFHMLSSYPELQRSLFREIERAILAGEEYSGNKAERRARQLIEDAREDDTPATKSSGTSASSNTGSATAGSTSKPAASGPVASSAAASGSSAPLTLRDPIADMLRPAGDLLQEAIAELRSGRPKTTGKAIEAECRRLETLLDELLHLKVRKRN